VVAYSVHLKKLWRIWLLACAGGLLFAYGVAVGVFRVFPYDTLEYFAGGAREWIQYPLHNLGLKPEKFLSKNRGKEAGVVKYIKSDAFPGQTFITGFFGSGLGMKLIDMDGRMLHEWRVSVDEMWPVALLDSKPRDDWGTQIHGAVLYPNGDVIFNFQYGGLVRIDKCSQVRWKLGLRTHHSIFIDTEGNLWVPGRKWRETAVPKFPNIPAPFWEDYIFKITPGGKLLREISVLDIIYEAGFEGVLDANGKHDSNVLMPLDRDFTHLNDVEVLSPSIADAFPLFEPGDLLLSLRNLNLLLVVDPATRQIKWTKTGPFIRQHDPDFLPTGQISVFDNRRDDKAGKMLGGSRIVKINLKTGDVDTLYGLREDQFFYTEAMGEQQMLPNGNILITDSKAGRAFEITDSGDVVWSFINRWDEQSTALIMRATRYPENYMDPIDKEDCS
jgi:Arylsulfotransferase (ASST)